MKLNERLSVIANEIKCGQTMADVGTDHGFLPLYLFANGICPKVIMTDLSGDSLNKAIEAFAEAQNHGITPLPSSDSISFRVGDGLKPIEHGEVDVVVIAGMGGVLMTQILGSDISKTSTFKKIILQPRNGFGKLRYWLENSGFEIVSEALAPEGKFICEILVIKPPKTAVKLANLENYPDDIEFEMPRKLIPESQELFKTYLQEKINIEKKILAEIISGKSKNIERKNIIEKRIEFLSLHL